MAVRLRLGDSDLAASLSDFLCRRDCAAALPSSSAVAVQPSRSRSERASTGDVGRRPHEL